LYELNESVQHYVQKSSWIFLFFSRNYPVGCYELHSLGLFASANQHVMLCSSFCAVYG